MKAQATLKIGRSIAVSTFALLCTAGVVHADWANSCGETGVSGAGYFTNLGSGGKAVELDQSQYDKGNLGPLSAVLWTPKRGAQGPMRDVAASKMAATQAREIESRLGPIGGRNTP